MAAASIPRRVLLTGGRSRLAAVIKPALVADGATLTSLSRTPGDSHRLLDDVFSSRILAENDTLLHLAWSTVPMSAESASPSQPSEDLPLLVRILESICALAPSQRPHFVFFSSGGAVYGNALEGRSHRETDRCQPVGDYARAKLAAENVIQDFGRRHGLSHTILRISNPYGFAMSTIKPQGLIPFIIKHAREGTPFPLWGDGTARKDFLYHTDFYSALRKILHHKPQGIFNVCSGASHTVNEVIALTEAALSIKLSIRHEPAHNWDVHDSLLDNSKLCAAIEWQPLIGLTEGIRRTVAGS